MCLGLTPMEFDKLQQRWKEFSPFKEKKTRKSEYNWMLWTIWSEASEKFETTEFSLQSCGKIETRVYVQEVLNLSTIGRMKH